MPCHGGRWQVAEANQGLDDRKGNTIVGSYSNMHSVVSAREDFYRSMASLTCFKIQVDNELLSVE